MKSAVFTASSIVETYLKGQSPEVNMIDVEFEEEFWNFVLNRILIFIEFFNKFINSEKMKIYFLKDGIDGFNDNNLNNLTKSRRLINKLFSVYEG